MFRVNSQKTAWVLVISFVVTGFIGGYTMNFDKICHQIVQDMKNDAFLAAGDFYATEGR